MLFRSILDLGTQDCIIGLKWIARFRVLLDPLHHRFIWPSCYPPTPRVSQEILLPLIRKTVHHCPDAQADADQRSHALEQDDIRKKRGAQITTLQPSQRHATRALYTQTRRRRIHGILPDPTRLLNTQPITIEPRATAKAIVEKGGI